MFLLRPTIPRPHESPGDPLAPIPTDCALVVIVRRREGWTFGPVLVCAATDSAEIADRYEDATDVTDDELWIDTFAITPEGVLILARSMHRAAGDPLCLRIPPDAQRHASESFAVRVCDAADYGKIPIRSAFTFTLTLKEVQSYVS